MVSEFHNLHRYTYDEFRRISSPADVCFFRYDTFVYADEFLTIAADDNGEWGFTNYYPVHAGWAEVYSLDTYDSPVDAFEIAREVDHYIRAVENGARFVPEIEGLFSVEYV